ncbi:unnamed protein product [Eruca vesicaria subsp. sativa]|uniref:Uncharacterized protein n=1 Tax=Eruca vesicaria subsp. sativa TaxID=29727 RepID=A0ABC8IS66_ERUVS|nr:unnamed protein product [Eruca vesicaria subsp. sativa]
MATNHTSDDESTRLYHPYQNYDLPIKSQYLYKLPTSPEYLFTEVPQKASILGRESHFLHRNRLPRRILRRSRGWDRLRDQELRVLGHGEAEGEQVLNSSGHKGRLLGCRVGVFGLIYAGVESEVVEFMDRDDQWTRVVAGLGTGAVFRAARGVRSAAVAGALGGMVAGGVVAGKQVLRRYAHI